MDFRIFRLKWLEQIVFQRFSNSKSLAQVKTHGGFTILSPVSGSRQVMKTHQRLPEVGLTQFLRGPNSWMVCFMENSHQKNGWLGGIFMDWKPHFFKQFWTDFSIQHVDFMGFKLGEYIRFIYGQHKGYLAGYLAGYNGILIVFWPTVKWVWTQW